MDLYFPPSMLKIWEDQRECIDESAMVCRDVVTGANKFVKGVNDMMRKQLQSVQIISQLSNTDYDVLLSENVVFLCLVDCSAVNTVYECIVRNTPIIVNRHPALEEVLGKNYPGFYDLSQVEHALSLCDSLDKVEAMHTYLAALDKTRYEMQFFLAKFADILNGTDTGGEYKLFKSEPVIENKMRRAVHMKFSRYLPKRYFAPSDP